MGATMVVRDTGEVAGMREYVATLGTGLVDQHALSAAYDAAVASLIGPNDVQQEGGRSFKKKSAWRKLARHFNLSVEAEPGDARIVQGPADSWVAVARATAVAPWGQRFTDVGACGSDESTGRRVMTFADALATAMTRAANRAISNLIAMGEVSAEEMAKGDTPRPAPAASTTTSGTAPRAGSANVMPFGRDKGKRFDQLTTEELAGAVTWAHSKDKFTEFQAAATAEIQARLSGVPADRLIRNLTVEQEDELLRDRAQLPAQDEPPMPDEPPY